MATKKKTKKVPAVRAAAKKTKPKVALKKARSSSKAPPKGRASMKRLSKKVAQAKRPEKKTAPTKRPAKEAAAKKGPTAKVTAKGRPAKAPPMRRRDGAGHLDPHYAATLREKSREGQARDRDDAFIGRSGHSGDDLAEALGETWVATATSGEDENEEVFNQKVPEDEGGPFVATTGGQEFAEGTDASNPKWSKREPFPKT
jgi:hypothetical protein